MYWKSFELAISAARHMSKDLHGPISVFRHSEYVWTISAWTEGDNSCPDFYCVIST